MEARNLAAVGLSLMLAANCFMPCYTLAYADEFQEVADVPQEEQEEVPGSSGRSELPSGDGESITDAADGGAAAEGHGPDDGAAEGATEDSSTDDGGLGAPIVYAVEPDSDYPIVEEGDGGIDDSYGGNDSGLDTLLDNGISPLSLTEVGYLDKIYFALNANAMGSSATYSVEGQSITVTRYSISWILVWVWAAIVNVNKGVANVNANIGYSNNYLKAIDTQTKNAASYLSSALGYNYGGTAVIYNGSPAHSLQKIRDYLKAPGSNGTEYTAADYLSTLSDRFNMLYSTLQGQWGYNYSGTAVLYKNSPAAWLENVQNYLKAPGSNGTVYTAADYLSTLSDKASSLVSSLNSVSSLLKSEGSNGVVYSVANYLSTDVDRQASILSNISLVKDYLKAPGSNGTVYTAADYLSSVSDAVKVSSSILDSVTKGPEGGRVSFYSIGNAVETIKNETRDLDNLLESIDGRVAVLDALGVRLANISLTADDIRKGVSSSLQWYEALHGDLSMLRHGAADLLPGYADWTLWDFIQGIYFDLGNSVDLLKGLQQTLTAWGNRWDSQDQYLMEWAKRWDALDKDGSWSESDKSFLFAKLDGISDRLSVEAGQTILDALLGEVKPQYISDQLTIVKEVARNRFPFCIPAMMQQMLGLMQSEAQVPHWEFDFFGSPLVLDLGDLEGFASVTRWASCFMLFLALLANTKRFIFDLGGGGK